MLANSAMRNSPEPSTTADPAWAWAPYQPDAARPWNLARAAHLFRRATFGAPWRQLQQALAIGPQRSIDGLLKPEPDLAAFQRQYDGYEAAAAESDSADSLRGWWLRRMVETPHPLLEKMTLFWQGHFAAAMAGGASARLIGPHLQLLRTHALGRLEPLLRGICRDPVVLASISAEENYKARPNEQLARVLLEVFTLGAGGFSEDDVRETARALTGWFVVRGQTRYVAREHDDGPKKILGQEGNWGLDDVVRIVLAAPATRRRLARRLYRWFVSETDEPGDELTEPLADALGPDDDLAKPIEMILRSNLFFSSAAYRQRIKSPVEYALGIVIALEGRVPTLELGRDLAALGQDLLNPPTVKGWVGGRSWLHRFTLAGRSNLALRLLAGPGTYADKLNPSAVARMHSRGGADETAKFLLDLFLQGDVTPQARQMLSAAAPPSGDATEAARRLAYAIVTLPEFQLA